MYSFGPTNGRLLLGVRFLLEELEEFPKEEACIRRQQKCPLEIRLGLMQIGLTHLILILLVTGAVRCTTEEMSCGKEIRNISVSINGHWLRTCWVRVGTYYVQVLNK